MFSVFKTRVRHARYNRRKQKKLFFLFFKMPKGTRPRLAAQRFDAVSFRIAFALIPWFQRTLLTGQIPKSSFSSTLRLDFSNRTGGIYAIPIRLPFFSHLSSLVQGRSKWIWARAPVQRLKRELRNSTKRVLSRFVLLTKIHRHRRSRHGEFTRCKNGHPPMAAGESVRTAHSSRLAPRAHLWHCMSSESVFHGRFRFFISVRRLSRSVQRGFWTKKKKKSRYSLKSPFRSRRRCATNRAHKNTVQSPRRHNSPKLVSHESVVRNRIRVLIGTPHLRGIAILRCTYGGADTREKN